MKLKNSISDYTESEFIDFMHEIDKENIAETDDKLDVLLNHFEKITEHPAGTDLLYYAQSDADSTPEAITKIVKEWRAKNGKPGFKKG
ncbi:bacteriocin immunity protein [Providencia stuartii]|uniref:bacteriocin immunity protein n=1 Tax=Providencia stuartii TaxID=588 RepID=UPI001FF2A395|nr:bacteriocin immunity protein [Providencia stuartii]ELZ5939811.1 bacteriocin immunity protein [Providencia stuartii]MCK1143295.1 bacteriocin immunity protein [Providencia stuartii]